MQLKPGPTVFCCQAALPPFDELTNWTTVKTAKAKAVDIEAKTLTNLFVPIQFGFPEGSDLCRPI